MRQKKALKERLDALYAQYTRPEYTGLDPIEFPHRYARPEDIEAAALIAAVFSYGRVDLFKPVIGRVLGALGDSPHMALRTFEPAGGRRALGSVAYRFNRGEDILAFLWLLSQLIRRRGSLAAAFFSAPGGSARDRLAALRLDLLAGATTEVYGSAVRPRGLMQLLPDPASGSAAKRMYMFLRWMVREDAVDFGLWRDFGAQNLVIPLDTHVARLSRHLGFTTRKTADYAMAVEITDSLRSFDPKDPVKYDFALAHLGISGRCPARPTKALCAACDLAGFCIQMRNPG
jgi:uncharacterized protein (TIGR02757 family)